jgi:hypothetical protein
MKQFSLVILGLLITVSAMSAIRLDRMRVITTCRDVRIGMDGGIGAAIETGGIVPRFSVSLFLEHYKSHNKLKTLDVQQAPSVAHSDVFVATDAPGFKFVIDKSKNANGRFPASLEATVEGKQVAVRLVCSK